MGRDGNCLSLDGTKSKIQARRDGAVRIVFSGRDGTAHCFLTARDDIYMPNLGDKPSEKFRPRPQERFAVPARVALIARLCFLCGAGL